MHRRPTPAMAREIYRAEILAVADRLCSEFPHLSLITVAHAMNDVRRENGDLAAAPATVYQLVRPRLAQTESPASGKHVLT